MPTADTLRAIDTYWASAHSCDVSNFYSQKPQIIIRKESDDNLGAWLFLRNNFCSISIHDQYYDFMRSAIDPSNLPDFFNVEYQQRLFGDFVNRIVGPAYHGYGDETDLTFIGDSNARLLNNSDEPLLKQFSQEVTALDWEHSGIEIGRYPIYGYFNAGKICAAADYKIWGGEIAHIGVVTHPDYRGKGCGKTVVSAIAQYAIDQKLIPQYRTLYSNESSIGIAKALGFKEYATTIVILLKQRLASH